MSEPEDKSSPQNEITLSEYFYKSRKQLLFFSGLLFMWTLVGMDIPNNPFPNVDVTITDPQAFPVILIVLIIYFGYRSIIEWIISIPPNMDEKPVVLKNKVLKLDFYISIAIPIAAISTFIIQKVLLNSLDNGLEYYDILILAFLIVTGGFVGLRSATSIDLIKYDRRQIKRLKVELENLDNDADRRSLKKMIRGLQKPRYILLILLFIVCVIIVTLSLFRFHIIFFLSLFGSWLIAYLLMMIYHYRIRSEGIQEFDGSED